MQETNLYTVTIPPMIKSLTALSAILDKMSAHADTKKSEWHPAAEHEAALLSDRLVFDQFSFLKQVQLACDNAKGAGARLAQIDIPVHEDNEKTVAELKSRIDKTVSFLKSVKPEQVIGKEAIKVTLRFVPDKHLTGFDYATEYVLPNFYFHVTTAYAILRKNGIDIGKSDFIGGLPFKD
jgi:hypothetical protein